MSDSEAWRDADPTACAHPGCDRGDACEEHLPPAPATPATKTVTKPATPRLTVYRARDLIHEPRPVEIIEGLAWEGRLTVVVAPSGDGKTFVLLDAAAAISDGVSWHGRTVRQGSVFYVSFEGDALGLRIR